MESLAWGGAVKCKETVLGVLYMREEPLFKDNSHMYLLCFFMDFGFGLIVIWNCDVEWRFVQCVSIWKLSILFGRNYDINIEHLLFRV
jgi:hypothetical protein